MAQKEDPFAALLRKAVNENPEVLDDDEQVKALDLSAEWQRKAATLFAGKPLKLANAVKQKVNAGDI